MKAVALIGYRFFDSKKLLKTFKKVLTNIKRYGIIYTEIKKQSRKAGRGIIMKKMFRYDVDLHFSWGWDTYEVNAECVDKARYTAIMRVINEISREYAEQIDCIRVYKHGTDKLFKEYSIA